MLLLSPHDEVRQRSELTYHLHAEGPHMYQHNLTFGMMTQDFLNSHLIGYLLCWPYWGSFREIL